MRNKTPPNTQKELACYSITHGSKKSEGNYKVF
jgi:hypothetical protein